MLPSLAMPVICIEKHFIMLPALRSTNTKLRPYKSRIKKKSIIRHRVESNDVFTPMDVIWYSLEGGALDDP